MSKLRPRGRICLTLAATTALISGCGASGTATNFDRSASFTDILSEADRSRPSDLSRHMGEGTLGGTATYEGAAAADFETFVGTSDATLVADFDNETISGEMIDWEDGSPRTHDLRGRIELSNGTINPSDGTFAGLVTGNLQRTLLGGLDGGSSAEPVVLILEGVADGTFHDSKSGEVASHIDGRIIAGYSDNVSGADGGTMTGRFVAKK